VESYEHRIVNGLLRELPAVATPEVAEGLLSQNVEIRVGERAQNQDDLWPCVWALAVAISKQFTGTVFLNFPSAGKMPSPTGFSGRVVLGEAGSAEVIRVGVGVDPGEGPFDLYGDTRGNRVSVGYLLGEAYGAANPIGCFALAGYLGFAALARAVGISSFADEYIGTILELPFDANTSTKLPIDEIAFLGLGQLGQAYLALFFFLMLKWQAAPRVFLLDKDRFEEPNEATQMLLESGKLWCGSEKSEYLGNLVRKWGAEVTARNATLDWTFKRGKDIPNVALLGFDNLETRRIAINGGFDWIVEGGIGTSLTKPRITWHSFLPTKELGRRLFTESTENRDFPEKEVFETLKRTPGQCGWFSFKNVDASAPAMGLTAAAYVWAETQSVYAGSKEEVRGMAYLWPSLLPFRREGLFLGRDIAA
jgi:hypothetical protein